MVPKVSLVKASRFPTWHSKGLFEKVDSTAVRGQPEEGLLRDLIKANRLPGI